jgi:hypothetical protein
MLQSSDKVQVWISEPKQAGQATIEDTDTLQSVFDGKLSVLVDANVGLIRVHAEDQHTSRRLSNYMNKHLPEMRPRMMSRCQL